MGAQSSNELHWLELKIGNQDISPSNCLHCDICPISLIFYQVRVPIGDQTLLFDEEAGPLRWFVLPSEVYPCLTDHSHAAKIKQHSPFIPATYPRTKDVSRSTEVAAAAPATPILLPGLVLPVGATIATTKCQIESEHTESHSSNKNRENIVDNSGQESRTVFAEGIKSDLNAGFINKIEDAPSEVCEKQSDPSNINGSQSQESAPPSLSSGETESSSTEQNGLQEDVNTSLSKIGAFIFIFIIWEKHVFLPGYFIG